MEQSLEGGWSGEVIAVENNQKSISGYKNQQMIANKQVCEYNSCDELQPLKQLLRDPLVIRARKLNCISFQTDKMYAAKFSSGEPHFRISRLVPILVISVTC